MCRRQRRIQHKVGQGNMLTYCWKGRSKTQRNGKTGAGGFATEELASECVFSDDEPVRNMVEGRSSVFGAAFDSMCLPLSAQPNSSRDPGQRRG